MATDVIELSNNLWLVKYVGMEMKTRIECNGHVFDVVFDKDGTCTAWFVMLISKGLDHKRVKRVNEIKGKQLIEAKGNCNNVWGPLICRSFPMANNSPYVNIQFALEFEDISPSQRKTLGEAQHLINLSKLLGSGAMADVCFDVKGQQMAAHSAILVAGSPVFAAMFQQPLQGDTKSVKIEDVEPEVFQQLLHYLYTGVAPRLTEMAEQLFQAAEKYQIPQLLDECVNSLIENLSLENVFRCLISAHLHGNAKLWQGSIRFVVKHKLQIVYHPKFDELLQSYPNLCFKVYHELMVAISKENEEIAKYVRNLPNY